MVDDDGFMPNMTCPRSVTDTSKNVLLLLTLMASPSDPEPITAVAYYYASLLQITGESNFASSEHADEYHYF
jgi:hypothetical protein